MKYNPSDKIMLSINVDTNGILGKIAKIKALNEVLTNEVNSLKNMINLSECDMNLTDETEKTVFDLVTSVTEVDKFSEIIFDLLKECDSPETIADFLNQRRAGLSGAIDYLKSRGYPIDRK